MVDLASPLVQNVLHRLRKADLRTNGVDVLAVRKRPVLSGTRLWLGGDHGNGKVLVAVSQLQCALLDCSL